MIKNVKIVLMNVLIAVVMINLIVLVIIMIYIGLDMIKKIINNYIAKEFLIMILINIQKFNLMMFNMQLQMNMQLNFGILFIHIIKIIFYSNNNQFNGQIMLK